MTLPAITAPVDTPVFLAAGHVIDEDAVFTDVATGTGHPRRRRVSTVAERLVSVRWFLTAEQLLAVEAWYEDVLQAGALPWSARVANQEGTALVWWKARWVSFGVEMLHRGRGVVSGSLFLEGDASDEGPETGVLRMELRARLIDVRSAITVPAPLAMEVTAALVQPVVLRMEVSAALANVYASA